MENPKKIITAEELKKHNFYDSCWIAINGKVYDATKYINSHPGGEVIVKGCGKDATEMFSKRPDGTTHSMGANNILERFYIGDLQI